jgi:hypothetical protein
LPGKSSETSARVVPGFGMFTDQDGGDNGSNFGNEFYKGQIAIPCGNPLISKTFLRENGPAMRLFD